MKTSTTSTYHADLPNEFILLYWVQTLVEHGNTVDFDIDAYPVKNTAKASSCYFFSRKIFTESFIESGKIGHIAQYHAHIDDIFRSCTRIAKYNHKIVQRLTCLCFDISWHNLTRGWVERPCPDKTACCRSGLLVRVVKQLVLA